MAFLTGCLGQMSGTATVAGDDYLGGLITHRQQSGPLPDNVSYWDGDGILGPPKIVIKRSEQVAYFYKGDQVVGRTRVSTGTPTHGTPPGRFKITEKDEDHRSSLYGVFKDQNGTVVNPEVDTRKDRPPPGTVYEGADMFNFMRFNGGVGMHAGLLPGYPASHGCVRMPAHMAKIFYENVDLGTPLIVE
jgi:lipoprotein-anchoring transpeptidase ErfK/SrfK